MNLWELSVGKWRPLYDLALWYLRNAPVDWGKEYLRHGVVGHTPRFVQFTNKDGIRFELDVHECVQKAIFCFHYFEPEDVAVFRRFVKPNGVLLDVGANIGQYSLLACKLMGDSGKIYAFEPSADVRVRLQKNIALNSFSTIEVVPCAVAASRGTMKFYPAHQEGNQGVGSLMPAQAFRSEIRATEGVDVDVVSVDGFCEERGIDRVDILKIDVEGYDLEVLKGAEEVMRRNPEMLIMSEVEPLNLEQLGATAKDFYAFMASHGFDPWYAEGGRLKRLEGETPPYHPNLFFRSRRHAG